MAQERKSDKQGIQENKEEIEEFEEYMILENESYQEEEEEKQQEQIPPPPPPPLQLLPVLPTYRDQFTSPQQQQHDSIDPSEDISSSIRLMFNSKNDSMRGTLLKVFSKSFSAQTKSNEDTLINKKILSSMTFQFVEDLLSPTSRSFAEEVWCLYCQQPKGLSHLTTELDCNVTVSIVFLDKPIEEHMEYVVPKFPLASKSEVFFKKFSSNLSGQQNNIVIKDNWDHKHIVSAFIGHFLCTHEPDYSEMSLEDLAHFYGYADRYMCPLLKSSILGFMAATFGVEKLKLATIQRGAERKALSMSIFQRDLGFMQAMKHYFDMNVSLEKRTTHFAFDDCPIHNLERNKSGDRSSFLMYWIYERWLIYILFHLEPYYRDQDVTALFDLHDLKYFVWLFNTMDRCSKCNHTQLPRIDVLLHFIFRTRAFTGPAVKQTCITPSIVQPTDDVLRLIQSIEPWNSMSKKDEDALFNLAMSFVHNNEWLNFQDKIISESFKVFILELVLTIKHRRSIGVKRRLFPENMPTLSENDDSAIAVAGSSKKSKHKI